MQPTVCLFCDFEGHHAGGDAGDFADEGLDRLLAITNSHGLRMTFNVVADLCQTHPRRIERIRDAGHEIGCHGWKHEPPRGLSNAQTRDVLKNSIDAFDALGVRPTGFRSPRSAWTMSLVQLLPEFGFRWSAERDVSWHAYNVAPTLARIAVKTDDWDLVDDANAVDATIEKWRGVVARVREGEGVAAIGLHEWIVGKNERFAAELDRFIGGCSADRSIRMCGIGHAIPARKP